MRAISGRPGNLTVYSWGQSATKSCLLQCPLSETHLSCVKLQVTRRRLYIILRLLPKCALWMWLLLGAAAHA